MGTMSMSMRQPENWLYEIWQKGHDSPCYVMVPNAKDLVKSHLMIAVREEVEVLKEKISELLDKINQLEVENTILKANMSQETLQQLQMQTQLQITGTGTINTTANILTSSGQTSVPPAAVQASASPATQSASVPAAVLSASIPTVGVGASPVVTAAAAGATPSPQPGSQGVAPSVSNNSPIASLSAASSATIYDGTNGDNLNNQTTNNCSSAAAAAESDDGSITATTADTNAGLIS